MASHSSKYSAVHDEATITSAFLDIVRAVNKIGTHWTLIGGHALRAHGVPRETLDADALISASQLEAVASALVAVYDWTPLTFDDESKDYAESDEVVVLEMDDPVLFDLGQRRIMIPLRSPLGLLVELLAAQHPVEERMILFAVPTRYSGVVVPVAPLGGVLLVKAKADRKKDVAAIEQAAEHLADKDLRDAIAWARANDPSTAEDVAAIIQQARARRVPSRVTRRSKR